MATTEVLIDGNFKMTKEFKLTVRPKVTLRDVARESGVSISTVSLILNRASLAQRLAAKTKMRVEEVANRLGYTPDPVARSLRKRQSSTVGVMIFDITDPYCTRLLKGIQAALMESDYLPLIMSIQNESDVLERYWNLMIERRVEGIIIVANWPSVDLMAVKGFPPVSCVVVGAKPPMKSMAHVMIDNVNGGTKALAHLYDLGHRNIAVLRGPQDVTDSLERWRGVQQFAAQVKLRLNEEQCPKMEVLPHPTSIVEEADRLTTELIARKTGFTALLVFDDLSAVGAIRAFDRAGWQLPRDCSVIGFDDIPYAQLVRPALTTMRQPLEEMGTLAVEDLLAQIKSNADGESIPILKKMVKAELVIRESTASPKEY